MKYLMLMLTFLLFICCNSTTTVNAPEKPEEVVVSDLPLDQIVLPKGFTIDVYADEVENARSLALASTGTLYVGTRSKGSVYALQDTDGDNKIDKKYILLENGNMPNGVAYRDGDLYIAEVNRILKFEDIESKLDNPGEPIVVYDKYPEEKHHGWKYINFGPDGKLYVPVGAPCNICESEDEVFNSITRMNADGTGMEIVQKGIRNTVGFTWHPETGDLWFTDNGRDMLGDDIPACELNVANKDGMHFGYPYCHQGDLPDPEYGTKRNCDEFTTPAAKFGPHTAPLGIEFYTGDMFDQSYHHRAFVAEHGSWNRSKKIGYKITMADINSDNTAELEVFAEGWLNSETDEVWGRPVDIELMPDGSMLVSDDFADVIYRISYKG